MKRIGTIVYVVLFLAMVAVPALLLDTRQNVVSEIDNRRLVELPVWGSETYTDEFESYIKDRIGGREQMISLYAKLHDTAFGELTHPTYTYGKDGYIFFNMHHNIAYQWFHQLFAQTVLKLQEYCEQREIPFYFIWEPEKISVYRQYLPEGVDYENTWTEMLLQEMRDLGIHVIDTGEVLREKAQTEQVFNVRYDAGHWNDLGCLYATNQVLARIREDLPAVKLLTEEDYEMTSEVAHALINSDFVVDEEVPKLELKGSYQDVSKDWSGEVTLNSRYPHFHYYINEAEGAETLPKILFFQGSYYNRGTQFLVPASSEYIGVHNYQNVLNLDYYVNVFEPDVVLLDAAEYVLSPTYFDQSTMNHLDLPPALSAVKEEREAEQLPVEVSVLLKEGEKVDRLTASLPLQQVRYAWLVSSGHTYDFREEKDGSFSLSCAGGAISARFGTIYAKLYSGELLKMNAWIREEGELLTEEPALSAGASKVFDSFVFRTDVKDNQFNYADLQLLAEDGTFLQTIGKGAEAGTFAGEYVHSYETGNYLVRLKGNSTLQDESAVYRVRMEYGMNYRYEFAVETLEEQLVQVKGLSLIGPR